MWLWSHQLSLLQPLDEPGDDGPNTAAVTGTATQPGTYPTLKHFILEIYDTNYAIYWYGSCNKGWIKPEINEFVWHGVEVVLTNLWQWGAGPTEPDNQSVEILEIGETLSFCHFVIGLLSSVAVQCVECGVWSIDDITITITITGHNRKVTSANKLFSQRSSNNKIGQNVTKYPRYLSDQQNK